MTFRTEKLLFLLAATAIVRIGAGGCASLGRGDRAQQSADAGVDGGSGGDGGGATSFSSVHPVLMDACARCHQNGGQAQRTALLLNGDLGQDYASAAALVVPGNPQGSRLLSKALGQGHVTVMTVGSESYAAVAKWIAGGAAR